MKRKILCILLCAMAFASCSDEWNRHYDGDGMDSAENAPTLWQRMEDDDTLNELCRVLRHMGYDRVFSSPQTFTVCAPMLTSEQADSVIFLYDQQKSSVITMPDGSARSMQDKDNRAIVQFVQNHVAMYGHSVAEGHADTISMMNGKNRVLKHDSIDSASFVQRNIVAANGILHTLASPLPFIPSVREAFSLQPGVLDEVSKFFSLFDAYSLDVNESVQQGVVDGKVVYADSVLKLSNELYSTLGWIEREDSDYLFVAPTDEVWRREYDEYLPLFHYDDRTNNRDSLARLNAQFAIVRGRFFNRRRQNAKANSDTLTNTMYVGSRSHYGLNVFERSTLLDGLTTVTCSNGAVVLDDEGRIDPHRTFLEDRYLPATSGHHRKLPLLLVGTQLREAVGIRTYSAKDSVHLMVDSVEQVVWLNELKNKDFIEVVPQTFSGVSNRNGSIYFYLPNTLAGLYYNVYVVMVPAYARAEGYEEKELVPTRFQVYYNERLSTPRTSLTADPNDDADYDDPGTDRALSVPSGETHSSGNQYFLTSGDKVDVICIDKARRPTYSAYNMFGSSSTVMRYRLSTNVRQTDLNKGTQTNVMRINRLIYIGFKTAEEAKAFELDMSNLKDYNISQ